MVNLQGPRFCEKGTCLVKREEKKPNDDAAGFKSMVPRWFKLFAETAQDSEAPRPSAQDSAPTSVQNLSQWCMTNAMAAWQGRNGQNLCDNRWTRQTSSDVLESWECCASLAFVLNADASALET